MLQRIARQCSRQLAAQQVAALHLSAPLEARRKAGARKDDSDEEDAQQKTTPGFSRHYQREDTEADWEWDTPFDASYTRNPDGTMPGLPMSELVAIDNGKWDFARNVSPALAAALQEAPDEGPEGIASAVNELIQMLEQLNSQEGGAAYRDEDLRLVAEAIDIYLSCAPQEDPEADGLDEFDHELLRTLGASLHEALNGGARSTLVNIAPPGRLPWEILDVDEDAPGVSWGVDLTGGKAEDPWKNALLSEETKEEMWELHSKRGWSAEQLAETFGIRVQRALAIVALKEREHAAAAAGQPLNVELAEQMEEEWGAHEVRGARERHHVALPSYPNYRLLTPADADRLAALLERRLGKPWHTVEVDDVTPEVAAELLAAAGVDQASVEEGLAAQEEAHLVAEFRRNLEYNLGKIGTSLSRASRKKHPPKRPEGGWGLRVIPLGGKKAAAAAAPSSSGEPPVQQQQPYVAATDGSRRPLTADEALLVERQQARPRSKIN